MQHATKISRWEVTLNDDSVVEVWADGFQELDGFYSYGVLVDAEGDVGGEVFVTNRTPSNPDRVVTAPARFPLPAVREINGG